MLELCYYNKRNFHFIVPGEVNHKENIFTILVGKNGTGKSRLLSAIAYDFIATYSKGPAHNDILTKNIPKINTNYINKPAKIITASTSPFDRFPAGRKIEKVTNYSYLGLRDLPSQNFGMAYMSKIISSLLEAIIVDNSQMQDISNVLEYLGYSDSIRLKFEPRLPSRIVHDLIDSSNPIEKFEEIFSRNFSTGFINSPINRRFFSSEEGNLDIEKVYRLLALLKSFNLFGIRKYLQFELTKAGIFAQNLFEGISEDIIFLMHSGVIRLREVTLEKLNSGSPYSINDASSGEQSVVLGFLGIASQIEDYSLICIDEPEICLHPEWQERYIKLLISTFKRYKGCHFIIATHSPQIISKLEAENCFVLSMENGTATNAIEYINNSIDFQLANVFKSPGFKNEYLSRLAFNTFAKASSKRGFDKADTENYQILLGQEKFLETDDPVYTLLVALKNMHKEYARNK